MEEIFNTDIIILNSKTNLVVSSDEFFAKVLELETLENLSNYYNITRKTLRLKLSKYVNNYNKYNCKGNRTLRLAMLEQLDCAFCTCCNSIKSTEDFHSINSNTNGIRYICKVCSSENRDRDYHLKYSRQHYLKNKAYYLNKNNMRRLKVAQASTKFGSEGIVEFYANCPEGYHVDHVVPINHPLVCGLHNIFNLSYLTKEDNLKKSNTFIVE